MITAGVLERVFRQMVDQEVEAERLEVDDLDRHVFAGVAACAVQEDLRESQRATVEMAVAYGLRLLVSWELARREGRGSADGGSSVDRSTGDGRSPVDPPLPGAR